MKSALSLSIISLSLCLSAGVARAQNVLDTSDLGGFRLHRAAGMKALNEARYNDAMAELAQAQSLINDSPSILLLSAQNALGLRDYAGTKAFLADYLKRGFVLDLNRNSEFLKVMDTPLTELNQSNQSPVGSMETVVSLSDFVLLDSIAYDEASDATFLSALKTGDILKKDGAGAMVLAHFEDGISPQGLGLHDGLLWASLAPSHQNNGFKDASAASSLVAIDATSGEIVKRFKAPDSDRSFGRILAGRDTLYVADLNHGEILRLDHYEGEVQPFIPEGFFDAPQAMAENQDASKLVISDFTSGLYVVDLAGGTLTRIVPPENASLLGITSLSLIGNDLIAVQNGIEPHKVLRLKMSDDWLRVDDAKVILRGGANLKQPAQGVVVGDHFRLIAQSQWEALSKTAKGQAGPAIVGDVGVE